MLHPAPPPYGLHDPSFPFPALAALAGRLSLGSGREAVLAALLGARLAVGAGNPTALTKSMRAARAAAAVHWLGATCPDTRVRAACIALAEATAGDDSSRIGVAVTRVLETVGAHLNRAARAELAAVARRFTE